ncbi:MAG TPA: MATE family efflux transporter [Bacillota bacterium]|jgi:putative MATE family efflux protein|nr:MATE family efflux transporter [Bacillota bacterium]HOL09521.1 MATE family efflux transporter [Bacillota bacterium]HPO98694.1 MATE family efflux transporter [Bacillota bacterium]
MIEQVFKSKRAMVFSIAIPIMIQSIVQHAMILVDRAFLGNLDSRYLAAIGNVMVPYNTSVNFFASLATGLTVLVAQNIGAKNYGQAKHYSESSFFYSSLLSIAMFFIWLVAARNIFAFFGAKGQILDDAVSYVQIISGFFVVFGIEITVVATLQGVGITRPIMIFGIIKSMVNVVLDWLLIFGKWGFPALGLEGAALATLIANLVGTIGLVITIFAFRNLPFKLSKRSLIKPRWEYFQTVLKVGLPSGMEGLLWFAGSLALIKLLNQIDEMAIGVFSLVNGLQVLVLLLYQGFAKATMTLVGQYWGEQQFIEARRIGLYCQKLASLICIIWTGIFMIFPRFLADIFTNDPQVITRAIPLIRLCGILIHFQAVNIITGHAIRATGDTKWMLYSQIFGTIFVIGMSWWMIFGFALGIAGMYLTQIFDEIIRGGINCYRFYLNKKVTPQSLVTNTMN